jgi:hypothetical protein
VTDRLTPLTPAQRAPLRAAYAAAREMAEHLGLDIQDDRITQAAVAAATPLATALALREAATEATSWSGVREWLNRRADRIEATGEREAAEARGRRERERADRQVIVTVLPSEEER